MNETAIPDPDGTFGENLIETMFATRVNADLERRGNGLARADILRALI